MDGSSWPARLPQPPAPQTTPPSAPPPPATRQQMDGAGVALHQLLLPFAAQQATAVLEHQAVNPPTAHLPGGQPPTAGAGAGPSNGSLAHAVPGTFSTFGTAPDLKAMLDQLSASNAAAQADLTRASPLGGVASLSMYPRHGLSPSHNSNEQSSSGAQLLNRSSNVTGNFTFTAEGSASVGVTGRGIQFHDSSAHTPQMLPFKSTPHHLPAPPGDGIRVSCLNIGGEFFMAGAGLFGVICSCHRLKMSITKFCEHAGGPAEKAGEIVHVENGMSIAQWFKFWTGVGGSFAGTKWDWPEWAYVKNSPEEYRLKSPPSKIHSLVQTGLYGGCGNITGQWNKQLYSSDLYAKGQGCTNLEKIVKRPGEANYNKGIDMHGAFTNNSDLLQSSVKVNLGFDKNLIVNDLDLRSNVLPSGSSNFKASMGNTHNGIQRAHNYGIFLGKNIDISSCGQSSTGTLNHDSRSCRPDTPHKIFQESLNNPSNTELKLGQASYHQSMSTLFTSVQSAVTDFQKSQSRAPVVEKNTCPMQTTKVSRSIAKYCERPFVNGNKEESHEVANGTKNSQGDALTDSTTNNSLISLFLSHLERNSGPEPIDDILNSNEHYVPKALDSARTSDHPQIVSGQSEKRNTDNHSELAPTVIHTKGRSESISLLAASGGYNPQELPHANSQEPLIYTDCQTHLLPNQPDAGDTRICKVSCPTNCRSCSHMSDKSHQIAHAETGAPCFYDKMVRTRETFECVDNLCKHSSLRASANVIYEKGKCCSSRKYLPSFCQNDHSNTGKSICGCCCKIQEDVSKLVFRPSHLCRIQFSGDDGHILASKHTHKDGLCSCGTSTQRSLLCSGEHILQSSCYACPVGGFHHRSYGGCAIDKMTKNTLCDALNIEERDRCCHESCCYSAVPTCLSSCGFSKRCDVRIDHTIPECKHQLQMPARCCSTSGQNEKSVSQCLSNRIGGGSIAQAPLLKDVSNEATNQPSVAIMERLNNRSEASVASGSWFKAVTEKKGAYRGSATSKGQSKFGFSSVSSSAVVTKFPASPEFKNMSSFNAKDNGCKNLCDEVSRIQECSISSYDPTRTGCEKALNGPKRIPESHLRPSIMKRKCNQIYDGNKLGDDGNEEYHFGFPKKNRTPAKHLEPDDRTRTSSQSSQNERSEPQNKNTSFSRLRCSTKHSESKDYNRTSSQSSQNEDSEPQNESTSFSQLQCSAKHSESDDYTRTSTQSSHEDSEPQNEGTSFLRRVFRTKRKYTTMHQIEPARQLHRQQKISKDCGEQQRDKVNFIREMGTSGRKRQVKNVINQDITEQHEENQVFARKLPKYVSLNCIINEPKSEDACSGSAGIDFILIATGIANDNRKAPKIVPLNLILKKSKRRQAFKAKCKAESIHLSKNSSGSYADSSDCSIYKPSVGNENYSTQAEDEMQVSKKSKYSHNDSRAHIEGHCRSPCDAIGEDEPLILKQLSIRALRGIKNRRGSISLNRINRLENFPDRPACNFGSEEDNAVQAREVHATRRLNSDASCCVCGIFNLDPCNELIECSKCYIKVHQGCYGVLKVPRGQWYCRPCKANTRNAVCVLCGYGGGAMARALKHKNILKSLLKGLRMSARAKRYADSFGTMSSDYTKSTHGNDIISVENITSDSWTSVNRDSCLLERQKTQWVHVVCGLWTPGTKCPNATTMSAFDVSGASSAKRNTACPLCSRTGGSFIKCRDLNCSVLFHPWCGHRRGLLQSEPEGEQNENVGFYGRCPDHAVDLSHHVNPKKECLRSNDWTCARVEGFKDRKGEGSNHKLSEVYCVEFNVSQEQINAWLHINGSKLSGRGQMEYTHYKQLKGWKHLVVYKSGIHGLGLYTSVFIQRGTMVVEYVGEIVGQRVADKREIEYQSGKRLQYKSACYFFKIDREHIIDATRKGGIARFINHSCQPNCVAKIISVRNEKKVVFFAERHINPGEEITYDYHFNREDEGQRIPCFCRSRCCRRYLN